MYANLNKTLAIGSSAQNNVTFKSSFWIFGQFNF